MSESDKKSRRKGRADEETPANWVDESVEWHEVEAEELEYHPLVDEYQDADADIEIEVEEPPPLKNIRVKLKPEPAPAPEPAPEPIKLKPKTPKRQPKPKADPAPKPAKSGKQPKPAPVAAANTLRTPVIGWIPLLRNKPKVEVKAGKAARAAKEEERKQPFSFWKLMVQMIPVWVLLIMILILEPALPFRAVGAVANWAMSKLPARPTQDASEPVFIVEGAGETAPDPDLPEPNWSLEISPIFTPSIQYWSDSIAQWSVMYRIKPNMIATIMQIESCGNPSAESIMGATGLFQVMPLHFSDDEEMFDPDTNAMRGMLYLGQMLSEANGDVGLAFAAYNGGPSMLYTSPVDWPDETQTYYRLGVGIYEDAEFGLEASPTLDEWLDLGGGSFCAQAASVLGIGQ